jgi:hypothetical protein
MIMWVLTTKLENATREISSNIEDDYCIPSDLPVPFLLNTRQHHALLVDLRYTHPFYCISNRIQKWLFGK